MRLRHCIVLSLVLAGAARAQAPVEKTDVVYTRVGDRELKLDIVQPAGNGPFPAVIAIHGGAWRGGNKSDVRPALIALAQHGYVAVSPQYRFCPKDVFPAQIHDVKAAVRWMRAHAAEYKIDPAHIGAMGFSAGGHLALMLGLTGPEDKLEGDEEPREGSSRVQAVVNYFGPSDLLAADIPAVSKPLIKDLLNGAAADKPELARQASPCTFATADDPPILTFQGTKDPLVPHTQATELAEALTRAGTKGRVELIVGAGHGWQGEDLDRTLRETLEFLDKNLKTGK